MNAILITLLLIFFFNQVKPYHQHCTGKPKSTLCPIDFIDFPEVGLCLKFFNSTWYKWETANNACALRGNSHLVVIASEMEERFIQEIVSVSDHKNWIWMSATTSSQFEWQDPQKRGPLNYTKWKSVTSLIPSPHKKCVVRLASTGYWDRNDCNEKLGYICSKRYVKKVKVTLDLDKADDAGRDVALTGKDINLKCTAWIYQRGNVELLWHTRYHGMFKITADEVKSLGGQFTQEISQEKDCMQKVEIRLIFPPRTLGHQPPFKCCLVVYGIEAECSRSVRIDVQNPPITKPKLIVGYHTPPPTIYLGMKLEAFCFTNNGIVVWAISSSAGIVIWSQTHAGGLHPNNPGSVLAADVFIKILKNKTDHKFGPVLNSSFSFVVKPEHDKAVLSCFSYNVRFQSDIGNTADPFRTASQKFHVRKYYPPSELKMEVEYDLEKDVVFENTTFSVNCSAKIGAYGLMSVSIQLNDDISQWQIDENGSITDIHEEIGFKFTKNITFVSDSNGPSINAFITFLATKSKIGTVVSCSTISIQDPLTADSLEAYWNQELKTSRLRVFEPTCMQEDFRIRRRYYQKTITYSNYTLVYFMCKRLGFVPEFTWPVMCYRHTGNGSLVWNATPPTCIPRPIAFHWFYFWFKDLLFLSACIMIMLLLITPYQCSLERGESETTTKLKETPALEESVTNQKEISQAHNSTRKESKSQSDPKTTTI